MNQNYTQQVIYLLQKAHKKGLTYTDLRKRCGINKNELPYLEQTLKELLKSGKITEHRHHYYWNEVTESVKRKPKTEIAEIVRLCDTFGFARLEDGTDLLIPGRYLGNSWIGDKVEIHRIPGRSERAAAEVIRIVEFGPEEFSGIVVHLPRIYVIQPDQCRNLWIPLIGSRKNIKDGDKVICKIIRSCDYDHTLTAQIVRNFGTSSSARICSEAILQVNGVSKEFPQNVLDEATCLTKAEVSEKQLAHRLDLRNECIFTIDSAEAKDLDDAVSVEKFSNGWRLGVHIADVSYYVRPDSALDQEALKRGTSIYYADQVIPMLPKELSNGICSLNPDEDRLTLSCILTLNNEGELEDFDFEKSVIRSRVKGVYSEVNAILNHSASEDLMKKYFGLTDKIELMGELCRLRQLLRKKRGAPEIDSHECKIITDTEGKATEIVPRTRGLAEEMIEEFMLLANEAAAMAGQLKKVPMVYRVHEAPSAEKIDYLREALKALQIPYPDLTNNIQPGTMAQILENAHGTDLEPIVSMQVLRSMSKAKYSDDPIGHFGLALENYAHFTSPIRRYPDLMVHRILSMLLADIDPVVINRQMESNVKEAARQATATELTAVSVERSCEDCYMAEYMTGFIGESFDAILISATPQGLYAALENGVEGLIRVEELPVGEYYYDEMFTYEEIYTRKRYSVGDHVRVRCISSNVNSGKIDFKLITTVC